MHQPVPGDARVVDQDRRWAQLGRHPLDRRGRLRAVGDVGPHRECPPTGLLDRRNSVGTRRLVQVEDGDGVPVGGQALGDGRADAPGGAGDDRGAGGRPGCGAHGPHSIQRPDKPKGRTHRRMGAALRRGLRRWWTGQVGGACSAYPSGWAGGAVLRCWAAPARGFPVCHGQRVVRSAALTGSVRGFRFGCCCGSWRSDSHRRLPEAGSRSPAGARGWVLRMSPVLRPGLPVRLGSPARRAVVDYKTGTPTGHDTLSRETFPARRRGSTRRSPAGVTT